MTSMTEQIRKRGKQEQKRGECSRGREGLAGSRTSLLCVVAKESDSVEATQVSAVEQLALTNRD